MANREVLRRRTRLDSVLASLITTGRTGALAAAAALIALGMGVSSVADEGQRRASITFYKINKIGQFYEVRIVRNTDKPGCHNFPKKTKVIRVGQVGFDYCEVFTDKNCEPESAVTATWSVRSKRDESKKHPTTRITPGNQWMLSTEENLILRSWNCVPADIAKN